MVQLVTHNIKVSVETNFEGSFYSDHKKQYAFSYHIRIDNLSHQAVQLISRFWLIKDALNENEIVEGDGVIGEQPVIQPNSSHQYSSGCILVSPFGSMQGYYKMKTPTEDIEVKIPLFKLNASFALN